MPTEQRRWTVNLISCINKVSDQWKMLANIQGKGRALDEKSERLLMKHNVSSAPVGETARKLLPTASLRISNGLCVWRGSRLRRSAGVHRSEAFSHLPAPLLKLCCWFWVWVIMLERRVVHCWSPIIFVRESTKCNKHLSEACYFREVQKLWSRRNSNEAVDIAHTNLVQLETSKNLSDATEGYTQLCSKFYCYDSTRFLWLYTLSSPVSTCMYEWIIYRQDCKLLFVSPEPHMAPKWQSCNDFVLH